MKVDYSQVVIALRAAARMSPIELRRSSGSGQSRSYFISFEGRTYPLKAILRLAYDLAGTEWDAPHSAQAASALSTSFEIVHVTERREEEWLERQRENVERWARPGQGAFRAAVIEIFGGVCPISGCNALEALDAAHVQGVADQGLDDPRNGWLLRTDLHRLFDACLMAIDPYSGEVVFATEVRNSYLELEGLILQLPDGGPDLAAFAEHWGRFEIAVGADLVTAPG